MQYIIAHYAQILVSVLAVGEIVSLFVPSASGTLKGLLDVVRGVPGVQDPKIGQ